MTTRQLRNRNQIFIKPVFEKIADKACKKHGIVYNSGGIKGDPRRAKMMGDLMEYLLKRDHVQRKNGADFTDLDKLLRRVYKEGIPV